MEHFFQKINGWFTFPALYRRMVDRAADGAVFVEIGSWYGQSTAYMAVEIVNSSKNIKFYAVDTWEGSDEPSHINDEGILKNKNIMSMFMDNMSPLDGIYDISPIRMLSTEAAKEFEDRSLDFVFIDAAHDYDNVKADIAAWWPKVKIGGWIGGHDYDPTWPGVIQATNEFFMKRGHVETFEGSWLHRKMGS